MINSFSAKKYYDAHKKLFDRVNLAELEKSILLIKHTFDFEKKIITCGNGGSAYTASHFITDWNKMVNLATEKSFVAFHLPIILDW